MRADKALTLFIKLLFGHCEIRTHDFLLKSSRFQDECHRPDSTKYPKIKLLLTTCYINKKRHQEELNL